MAKPSTKSLRGKKTSDAKWNQNFKKLKLFKHEHGHCTAPYSYHDHSLYVLVCKQREHWNQKQIQNQHYLSDERKAELIRLGFVFDLKEHRWSTMFNKLLEHKRQYNTLTVPSCVNKQLCKWVNYQRKAYKLKLTGKGRGCELSQERIDRLLAIGFIFDPTKMWDLSLA